MKRFSLLTVLVIFSMVLGACGGGANVNQGNAADNAAPQEEPAPANTDIDDVPAEEPAAEETAPEPEAHTWLAPAAEEPGFPQRPPTETEVAAGETLANLVYPIGDWLYELFVHGLTDTLLTTDGPAEEVPTRALGSIESFWITNHDLDTWNHVDMKLLGISEHGYFWFDTDREPKQEDIDTAMIAFEEIYAIVHEYFGPEDALGIDGDPHTYVLHPAGTKLCNVDESTAHQCTIAGYFWGLNQFPSEGLEFSFEHEAIIMNYDAFTIGGRSYTETLVHEFRHLVEFWYDEQGEVWEAEGSAQVAEVAAGLGENSVDFANIFLAEPDVQLNTWSSTSGNSTLAHYGQSFLFHLYIFDRFGPDFYRTWQQDPAGGLSGFTKVLQAEGLGLTGEQVWLDWMITLSLADYEDMPAEYNYTTEFRRLDTVSTKLLVGLPRTVEEVVHQTAADIYRIKSETDVTINFSGSTLVPLLSAMPPSGNQYWYSGRVGGLNKLTLAADLTSVDSATLQFSTYYKLDKTYGFGYVVVSTDGGETWQGLVSENMRGEVEAMTPSTSP